MNACLGAHAAAERLQVARSGALQLLYRKALPQLFNVTISTGLPVEMD
jgi:hypothetical protein